MKVSSEMIYLGYEDGKTQNGKDYCRVGLLQGFDSEQVYINDEIKEQVRQIKPMTPVTCLLNIRIGQERTFVNLLSISPLDNGKVSK